VPPGSPAGIPNQKNVFKQWQSVSWSSRKATRSVRKPVEALHVVDHTRTVSLQMGSFSLGGTLEIPERLPQSMPIPVRERRWEDLIRCSDASAKNKK